MASARRFDGIDVADQVGDGHVGRGQLFDVAMFRSEPCNRRRIFFFGNQFVAAAANGRVWIVMDFASGNVRHLGIEQRGQGAQNAALGLSPQAEQDEIMARENRVHDLRHDGIVIADNARENRRRIRIVALLAQTRHQIGAHLVFHAPRSQALL